MARDANVDGEIQARAVAWLSGDSSWDDFERWFVGFSLDHDSPMIAELNAVLAIREDLGHDELGAEVRRAVSTIWLRQDLDMTEVREGDNVMLPRRRIQTWGDVMIRGRLEPVGT